MSFAATFPTLRTAFLAFRVPSRPQVLPGDRSPPDPRAYRLARHDVGAGPVGAVATVIAAGLLLGGCGAFGTREADTGPAVADDFLRSRLVAADFVDVMSQLPELAPARTELWTPAPDSRFGELLFGALQDEGYVMKIGAGRGDALGYDITAAADAAGSGGPGGPGGAGTYTFLVSAGPVKLKRDYAVDAEGIRPASRMLLHGADASNVTMDHARFDTRLAADTATGTELAASKAAPAAGSLGASDPSDPSGARASASTAVPATAVVARAVPVTPPRKSAAPAPRANMYETRRSAFEPILARYETVSRSVMVFGNDSLVMGADNKRDARQLARRFDPATDIVSLIGCSHGRTALDNGNETLALGRAARVKEELLLAGLAPELVLDEGCWAGTHFDKMPARGVVVTHKRRAQG